jgi:sphingomyelin phosphodiesterase acid-like 3
MIIETLLPARSMSSPSTQPAGWVTIFMLASAFLLAAASPIRAQAPQPAPTAPAAVATVPSIPVLFLSDIHLDPYADPAKVAKLNAAPASEWPAILAAPQSPTQPDDSAALQKTCPVRGVDTPNLLWRSSLNAIQANAGKPGPQVQFVTLTGDLLAHAFDCKYKTLLPAATHADYLAFVEKTIRYIASSLREALPGVPIYIALGNNDSGCTDYQLSPTHDEFLPLTAPVVADSLPGNLSPSDRSRVLADFSAGGYYSAPLADVPHTRVLVLDDLVLSTRFANCSGKPDPVPGTAQLAWLESQLAAARQNHDHVWVLGHIPPGVDLYSTGSKLLTLCAGGQPQMFLGSERLAEILASYADTVSLALFGHTHSDEMRLLKPEPAASTQPTTNIQHPTTASTGVPVKIVSSITPVNGNRPTFTLAKIDPATATLVDYTVFIASNLTGIATTWSPEYTYSSAFHKPAFDAPALASLIAGFHADPAAKSAPSQAYLRDYFPGDISALIRFAWPQYSCSMDRDSAQAFTTCVCASAK